MSNKLKLGIVNSSRTPLVPYTVGAFLASDVLSALSGRFVVYDESDTYWRASNSGEATLNGYVEQHLTCSSTNGGSKLPIFDVRGLTFELPWANATDVTTALTKAVLDALIGQLCDIYVASNIQYADSGATSDNIFRIVGGDPDGGTYGTLFVQVVDGAIQDIA